MRTNLYKNGDIIGGNKMGTNARQILHVDMDAFFASIEQRENPVLRGKPVLVGGGRHRGVVAAASYEARPFGIRSGMPTAHALRLCRHAILIRTPSCSYAGVAQEIRGVFHTFTPRIESTSLDEAYLDMTGTQRLFGAVEGSAQRLKESVRRETGLACTVGIGPNRLLAKMASNLAKPDGLLALHYASAKVRFAPLALEALHGVGPAMANRLRRMGLDTLGDLMEVPQRVLEGHLGPAGVRLWQRAQGYGESRVTVARPSQSISRERTFFADSVKRAALEGVLSGLAQDVARAARRKLLQGNGVWIKVRYGGGFHTITRRHTLSFPTASTRAIRASALSLFAKVPLGQGIRLLGVGMGGLGQEGLAQGHLFPPKGERRESALDKALDRIAQKHGPSALRYGGTPALRRREG